MGLPALAVRNDRSRWPSEIREAIVAARLGGMPYLRIARVFGVPYATVHRICKESGA
jgi:DNA-directed RNA polymerase specialized sigma24 family protein